MENERNSSEQSPTGPESPNVADCRGNGGNQGEPENQLQPETGFVAAFHVTFVRNNTKLRLSSPLNGGGELVIEDLVGRNTIADVADLIRLPIKDLANPGVALVVRSSFERLVRAARAFSGPVKPFEAYSADLDEVVAALEPFAEVAS